MAPRTFANAGAQSTCASPITNSQTTVTVVSASGFPAIPAGTVTDVIIMDSGAVGFSAANPLASNYEYQPVSSITGNVLTFGGGVRAAYAGTTPKAYSAGATIAAVTLAEGLIGTMAVKIGESALSGLGTSFPAIAIPSGFRSLMVSGRIQGNGATVDLGLQFNGDGAANYAYLNLYNNNAGTPLGGPAVVTNSALVAQALINSSASFVAYIGGHSVATLTNHPVISMSTAAGIVMLRGAYWNQATGITSVAGVSTGNCVADSFIEVHGIP